MKIIAAYVNDFENAEKGIFLSGISFIHFRDTVY